MSLQLDSHNKAPEVWHHARLVRRGQAHQDIHQAALAEVAPKPAAEHLGKRHSLGPNQQHQLHTRNCQALLPQTDLVQVLVTPESNWLSPHVIWRHTAKSQTLLTSLAAGAATLHAMSTSCPTHQHSRNDLLQVLVTLKAIGFQDRDFDAIVTGDDVTRNKPDPSIFLTAASRVGVDPGSCVVLEDAQAGMQAAQAAGEMPPACSWSKDAASYQHIMHSKTSAPAWFLKVPGQAGCTGSW